MKSKGTSSVLEAQWSVPCHNIVSKTEDKFFDFAPHPPDRGTVFDRSLLIWEAAYTELENSALTHVFADLEAVHSEWDLEEEKILQKI